MEKYVYRERMTEKIIQINTEIIWVSNTALMNVVAQWPRLFTFFGKAVRGENCKMAKGVILVGIHCQYVYLLFSYLCGGGYVFSAVCL